MPPVAVVVGPFRATEVIRIQIELAIRGRTDTEAVCFAAVVVRRHVPAIQYVHFRIDLGIERIIHPYAGVLKRNGIRVEKAVGEVAILDAFDRLSTDMRYEFSEIESHPLTYRTHVAEGGMLEGLVKRADARGIAELNRIHDDVLRVSGCQINFEADPAPARNLFQLYFREIHRKAVAMDVERTAFDRKIAGLNGRRPLIGVRDIPAKVIEIHNVISFDPTAKLDALQRIDFCDFSEILRRAIRVNAIHLLSRSHDTEGSDPY